MSTSNQQSIEEQIIEQGTEFMLGLVQFINYGMKGLHECPGANYLEDLGFIRIGEIRDSPSPTLITGITPSKTQWWYLDQGKISSVSKEEHDDLVQSHVVPVRKKVFVPENPDLSERLDGSQKDEFSYVEQSHQRANFFRFRILNNLEFSAENCRSSLCARGVRGGFDKALPLKPYTTGTSMS